MFEDLIPDNKTGESNPFGDLIPKSGMPFTEGRDETGVPIDAHDPDEYRRHQINRRVSGEIDRVQSTVDGRPIDTNMYDGVETSEEAWEIYRKAKERAPSLGIDPSMVPGPTPSLLNILESGYNYLTHGESDRFDPYTTESQVPHNIITAGKNIAVTGAAAIDTLQNPVRFALGLPMSRSSEILDESLPESVPAGDWVDQIGKEAVQLGTGAMTGTGVYQNLARYFGRPGNSRLGKLVYSELGMASAVDPEMDTIIVGDNALIGLGLGAMDPDGQFNHEILENRFALMIEAGALGTTVEKGLQAGAWTLGFINDTVLKPLVGIGSKSSQEQRIGQDILNNVFLLEAIDDPKRRNEILANLSKLMKEAQAEYFDTGLEGLGTISTDRTTMETIRKVLSDNPNMDWGDLTNEEIMTRASQVQAGARRQPRLEERLDDPNRKLRSANEEAQRLLGGDEAIDTSRDAIQETAIQQRNQLLENISRTEQRLERAEVDAIRALVEDPNFGDILKQIDSGGTGNINLVNTSVDQADEAVNALVSAKGKMDAEKDRLFGLVTTYADDVGLKADKDAFIQLLEEAGPDEIPNRISRQIEDWGGDFSTLYNKIRNNLSREISRRFRAGEDAELLLQLRDNINDYQMERLLQSDDMQVVELAGDALAYFKETYAPVWRDALGDFSQLERQVPQTTRPQAFQEEARRFLEESTSGTEYRERMARIVEVTPDNPELLANYAIARAADDLMASFDSVEGIDPGNMKGIVSSLRAVTGQLPSEQQKRVMDFIEGLTSGQKTKAQIVQELEGLRGNLNELEVTVFDNQLKEFFDRNLEALGEYTPKRNASGYEIFKSLFDNPTQNQERLRLVLERARSTGDESVVDGLQAAYLKYLNDKFFNVRLEPGGGRKFNVGPYKAIEDGGGDILRFGDTLFEDRPGMMEFQRSFLQYVKDLTVQRQAMAKPLLDASEFTKGARGASDRAITAIFGVLNRIGARVRSASSAAIGQLSPDDYVKSVQDSFLANPDDFLDFVDDFRADVLNPNVLPIDDVMSQGAREHYYEYWNNPKIRNIVRKVFVRQAMLRRDDDNPLTDEEIQELNLTIDEEFERLGTNPESLKVFEGEDGLGIPSSPFDN